MGKMSISERAKIFMPFDALRGFKEALKEKEKILVPKKELSAEQKEAINASLVKLQCRMLVDITYYSDLDNNYLNLVGVITKISLEKKQIIVVKTIISFEDICSIDILKEELK